MHTCRCTCVDVFVTHAHVASDGAAKQFRGPWARCVESRGYSCKVTPVSDAAKNTSQKSRTSHDSLLSGQHTVLASVSM